jgi:hypothetical protein
VEVDWAEVDPDEVFRRLPVAEVRRVEQKMRTDALNKQSELRSMVGLVFILVSSTIIANGAERDIEIS